MKRSIKLAVAAAVALTSTAAFATNGDHLIGLGAKARGMGGAGIGISHGAESALANPAMITTVKGAQVSFGGTVFMPDVQTDMGTGGGSLKSDADLSVIPEVALASKVNDSLWLGVGMWGTAGMGTDYSDELDGYDQAATLSAAQAAAGAVYLTAGVAPGTNPIVDANAAMAAQGTVFGALGAGNFAMKTNLQLMQFAVPVAFKMDALSIGIAPILQYGSLDINYNLADASANLLSGNTRGVTQDFGFGYNIGAAYEMSGLTLGASYKSAIDMEYKGQISKAISDFTQGQMTMSDHLEQPAEMGLGASYKMGEHTFAMDYKRIKWSDAKGYKDFGWEDQNVYILGYEFATQDWAARLGYNHAKSAVVSQANTLLNTLNILGFPATVESHYTIGGTYNVSKTTSFDVAYVYSPEVTDTFANMLQSQSTTKHSQDALSMQVNFAF
jgi:long-chain fatty acid transport protein